VVLGRLASCYLEGDKGVFVWNGRYGVEGEGEGAGLCFLREEPEGWHSQVVTLHCPLEGTQLVNSRAL